jgi:hypothetical protein
VIFYGFLDIEGGLVVVGFQRLDVSGKTMKSLPDELSGLKGLKELLLNGNAFTTVLVSVLSGLTALMTIDLSQQHARQPMFLWECGPYQPFEVTCPLLPMLHPGLVKLDLRQRMPWDSVSMFHLGDAMAALADRNPHLTLLV